MVAYDIGDDRRRRKVHGILKDYGKRVQFSVFECRLSSRQLASLRRRLAMELLEDGDSVRWYPLCSWCSEAVSFQGAGLPPDDEEFIVL